MSSNLHLGRIVGIDIGANWSFVFIFGLVTSSLAAAVLPELAENEPAIAYVAVAVVIAALFFVSLIAHEMGHAIVARRHGIEVREITLWLLGGVSKLEGDSSDAGTELRIAVAGPAVSFTLGVAWFVVALAAAALQATDLLVGAVLWLSFINVVLGLFNCLPAFPLDGGRILRAYLWWRGHDRLAATSRAVQVGMVVAYGLIALGFLEALTGAGIGGLWLALIGWFVLTAGRGEGAAVEERELLAGVTVRDIMTRDPAVLPAELEVQRYIDQYLLHGEHTSYPVVDPMRRVVGLFTPDLLRSVPLDRRASTTLGAIAIPRNQLDLVTSDEPATRVIPLLARGPSRSVLVIDGDTLVGIVSGVDIARALHDRALRASLRPLPR